MLEIAVDNTDRLTRLVNEFLDLDRLQSGRLEAKLSCVRRSSWWSRRWTRRAVEGAGTAGVDVAVETQRRAELAVGRRSRIVQVLTNLLSNAIKFSVPGGRRAHLVRDATAPRWSSASRTSGEGIPADQLDAIFERFQQVDPSDTRQRGGTGLGLTICRNIVKQLGGRITVESTLGIGSTFQGGPARAVQSGRVLKSASSHRGGVRPDTSGMVLDIALVGTGGAMPLPNRWLSSVLVRYGRHLVLFDCGEGTQISLRALGWGLKDIDLLLISHVHGDHTTGLPGLLLTQANSGRTEPVQIVGPPGFGAVLAGLMMVAPYLPFELRCSELDSGARFELDDLHSHVRGRRPSRPVPRLSDRRAARAGAFCPERARALGVPVQDWKRLQRGETVGAVPATTCSVRPGAACRWGWSPIPGPPTPSPAGAGVDLLVCEGTYGSDDDQPRAVERKHMTFREAAELARQARSGPAAADPFQPVGGRSGRPSRRTRPTCWPASIVGHDHFFAQPAVSGGVSAACSASAIGRPPLEPRRSWNSRSEPPRSRR